MYTREKTIRTSWHEKSKASEMSITMECVARRQSRQSTESKYKNENKQHRRVSMYVYSVDGTGLMSLTASLWSKMTNTNKKYVHK